MRVCLSGRPDAADLLKRVGGPADSEAGNTSVLHSELGKELHAFPASHLGVELGLPGGRAIGCTNSQGSIALGAAAGSGQTAVALGTHIVLHKSGVHSWRAQQSCGHHVEGEVLAKTSSASTLI